MKREWGNSSNSKGNPIDLKTGHPFKCYINCDAEEHFSRFCPKPKRRRSYPVYYNKGNEEEGDNYTSNRPGFPVPGIPVPGLAILSCPGPGQVTFLIPVPVKC